MCGTLGSGGTCGSFSSVSCDVMTVLNKYIPWTPNWRVFHYTHRLTEYFWHQELNNNLRQGDWPGRWISVTLNWWTGVIVFHLHIHLRVGGKRMIHSNHTSSFIGQTVLGVINDPGSHNAQASTHEWMCFGRKKGRRGTNTGGGKTERKREQKQMSQHEHARPRCETWSREKRVRGQSEHQRWRVSEGWERKRERRQFTIHLYECDKVCQNLGFYFRQEKINLKGF